MTAREAAVLRDRVARARTMCVGCGGDLNEQTPGCRPCSYRLSKRRKRLGIPTADKLLAEVLRLRARLARLEMVLQDALAETVEAVPQALPVSASAASSGSTRDTGGTDDRGQAAVRTDGIGSGRPRVAALDFPEAR